VEYFLVYPPCYSFVVEF